MKVVHAHQSIISTLINIYKRNKNTVNGWCLVRSIVSITCTIEALVLRNICVARQALAGTCSAVGIEDACEVGGIQLAFSWALTVVGWNVIHTCVTAVPIVP